MGESSWIDDDAVLVAARGMQPVNEMPLVVALVAFNRDTQLLSQRGERVVDLYQRGRAINHWLPRPEEIQVRTVEYQNMEVPCGHTQTIRKGFRSGSSLEFEAGNALCQSCHLDAE